MITIDDCLAGTVKIEDLQLGWVLTLDYSWLQPQLVLSYTFRDFDWKSVQNSPDSKVNLFLASDLYAKMKSLLDEARERRKAMLYRASTIAEMKLLLDNDNVKLDFDKLVRAKVQKLTDKTA